MDMRAHVIRNFLLTTKFHTVLITALLILNRNLFGLECLNATLINYTVPLRTRSLVVFCKRENMKVYFRNSFTVGLDYFHSQFVMRIL